MFTSKNIKHEIQKYSDFEIFKHYCPDVSLSRNCQSPLRNDDSDASFNLFYNRNGNLTFHDFGLGVSGNVFEFVKLLYGISYEDSVIRIYKDLKGVPHNKKIVTRKTNTKSKFNYGLRKPLVKDKMFWKQYLNSLSTLNVGKVYPLNYFVINNNFFKPSNAYLFKVGSRVKIYNPNNKPKYFGNTNSSSIQGWHMLNKNRKDLLLVSSMKEILVCYELGIQAIAPNAESVLIPPKIMNFLKFYWDIEILYDWDKTGKTSALKHSAQYNIKINKFQFDNVKAKDISDFRKLYGYSQLNDYVKK